MVPAENSVKSALEGLGRTLLMTGWTTKRLQRQPHGILTEFSICPTSSLHGRSGTSIDVCFRPRPSPRGTEPLQSVWPHAVEPAP